MKANRFVIKEEYKSKLEDLSQQQKGELLDVIMSYHFDDEIPKMSQPVKVTFNFLQPDFDKYILISHKRSIANSKRKKVGAPIGNQNARKENR